MAGTTPNLGLYLPGGGSTGTWTPDEVADIDPVNQNFQKIDTFAGTIGVQTARNQQFYGPAGAISGATPLAKLGDQYQESDGEKRIWYYDGANWTAREGACALIRPSAVSGTGAAIVNGVCVLTAANAVIRLDGIFPAKYDRVAVEAIIDNQTGDIGVNFQVRTAAAAIATGYIGTFTEQAVGIGPTKVEVNGGTSFGAGRVAVNGGIFIVEFARPTKTVGLSKQFLVRSQDGAAYHRIGGGYVTTSLALDGIELTFGAGTNGKIRVLGYGPF